MSDRYLQDFVVLLIISSSTLNGIREQEVSKAEPREQPFPDSWIATTAPIALGLLTDIASEVLLKYGADARERLLPFIVRQFLVWCIGRPLDFDDKHTSSSWRLDVWWPCEALVRVACNEMYRLPHRISEALPGLDQMERIAWTKTLLTMFSAALSKSVTHEKTIQKDLFETKARVYIVSGSKEDESTDKESNEVHLKQEKQAEPIVETIVLTPYGKGHLVETRKDSYSVSDGQNLKGVTMNVINLDSGATLYRPAPDSASAEANASDTTNMSRSDLEKAQTHQFGMSCTKLPLALYIYFYCLFLSFVSRIPTVYSIFSSLDNDVSFRSDASREAYWLDYVPALKVRCVAAYCLQSKFFELFERFVPLAEEGMILRVLEALKLSRRIAEEAVHDEDLKHVFQEAIVSEWGDGVEEVEQALSNVARLSHLHGSAMFFLTQEAGATKALIQMLGILYQGEAADNWIRWDRQAFAEPHLLSTMKEALEKFQESEERDGHLIDPNVWRNASESGGKVALYCTAFADVVVGILSIILSLDEERFRRHSQDFFPIICSLVRADSKEIRSLVHRILALQIAPMIGVDPNRCDNRCYLGQTASL